MSRLTGRGNKDESKENFMEIDEATKPDAGVNLVHLTYYRDFGDIFAANYRPPVRPCAQAPAPAPVESSTPSAPAEQEAADKKFSVKSSSLFIRRCKHSVVLGAGSEEPIELTTGHIARFAAGSVVASQGDNAVLATCVYKPSTSNQGFTPLTVDYRQSAAAVGKIPTNYLRREMSQSDADIIASRIIDRTVRPLFPKGWGSETQVICKPLSLDEQGDGIILAVNAAGAALHLSSIPFLGPVAAVRLALVDGKIIVNPSRDARRESALDMVLSGCGSNKTVMIEMDGQEISTSLMEEIIDRGFSSINEMLRTLDEFRETCGHKKAAMERKPNQDSRYEEIQRVASNHLEYILTDPSLDKLARDNQLKDLGQEIWETQKIDPVIFWHLFYEAVRSTLRRLVLETGFRCDGRKLTDFRPISIQVDVYKKLHGSALFQRGQTQVFSTVTFDSPAAAFQPDSISQMLGTQRKKMFMHHYEFPGFATNDISASRGSNRREIGHGALAEKALKHVIPKDFPYSIRLASQVLESNGSSSMASICAGSLALFDAGVPLKAPAAGVAMGIITGENPDVEYKILTDLLGIEDYNGDMDFKIGGTRNGLTAMQLDVKIGGLTRQQLSEALLGGQAGIEHVLDKMAVMRDRPREEFKSTVPVIENLTLEPFKRQILFRGGAYNAKLIEAETGVKITVEDENQVSLFAPNRARLAEAKQMIAKMISSTDNFEIDFGTMIKVEVVEMLDRGVNVQIPGSIRPVFIPNSSLHPLPIQHSSATGLKAKQNITVQWLGRDPQSGQIRLSRRTITTPESSRQPKERRSK